MRELQELSKYLQRHQGGIDYSWCAKIIDRVMEDRKDVQKILTEYHDEHTRANSSGTGQVTICTCRLCNIAGVYR